MKSATSLNFRLTASLFLTSFTSILFAGAIGTYLFVAHLKSHYETSLFNAASEMFREKLEGLTTENELEEIPKRIQPAVFTLTDPIVRVLSSSGVVVYKTSNAPSFLDVRSFGSSANWPNEVQIAGQRYDVMESGYRLNSGEARTIQILQPLPPLKIILEHTALSYGLALFFFFVASILVARFLTSGLLKPIKTLAEHFISLGKLEPTQWSTIPQQPDGEFLGKIVTAGNYLIASTQQSFLSNHNMAKYIAHEIRTPLTMMLGEIETTNVYKLSPDEFHQMLQRFGNDIVEIEVIVRTILQLAKRSETDLAQNPKPYLLSELLETAAERIEAVFGVAISLHQARRLDVKVFVDADLFGILLDNLLRNSLKHGGQRTKVRIFSEVNAKGFACIRIEDNGVGLHPDLLSSANAVGARGLGIGLTLCKEVCRLTDWELKFEDLKPHGLRVLIRVPLVQDFLFNPPEGPRLTRSSSLQ